MSGPVKAGAQIIAIAPDHVLVPERIGFYFEDKATALGRLIAVHGQNDPIKVTRNAPRKPIDQVIAEGGQPWRLVVGLHRLDGCKREGLDVLAIEVSGTPDQLREMEASENNDRRKLAPIEDAKFVAAVVNAAQERLAREHGNLSQHQIAVKARWERVKRRQERFSEALDREIDDAVNAVSTVYGWKESVAEALQRGKKDIQRAFSLYRHLIAPFPDLIEDLARHPVVGENASELAKIAAVDEDRRRAVIQQLIADLKINADEARRRAGVHEGKKPEKLSKDEKAWSRVNRAWKALDLEEKRRHLPRVASSMLHTPGLKVAMHALLTEQIAALRAAGKLEDDHA